MENYKKTQIKDLAEEILKEGLRVFVAENGEYGFFTDTEGTRVCSFQLDLGVVVFSGNYKSTNSGTGWRLDNQDASFADMLYANAPEWAIGKDRRWSYTTLLQHLENYQPSSRYEEQHQNEQ